jgi:antitoxin (DNA-binding transcriptional repressor) of toxin-antitoxin stability system
LRSSGGGHPTAGAPDNVGAVLRRAEAGESFIVTVDGRPVAQLGPLSGPQRPAHPDALRHLLADTPVDRAWADELAAMRVEDDDAAADPRRG